MNRIHTLLIWLTLLAPARPTDLMERTVRTWSYQIHQAVSQLRDVMGVKQLSMMYNESIFGVQEMTDSFAKSLLDGAIQDLTTMIRQKEQILEKLRDTIEEEYKQQDPLDVDECYIRAKAVSLFPYPPDENGTVSVPCNESQYLQLEADPLFYNFYVSRQTSSAHVPTNVYDLSKAIRTVGNWTYRLDEVFRQNLQDDPLLKWQYFCSSTGFLKFFPGAMWKVQLSELKLDFFDCRSTPWYVGAASYPIEMVILADKSGSMKGRRNTICNATISELLNTLTDDDFFNVIYFSETIRYAEQYVTDRLIQATRPNKDRIVRGFANHMPNGTSNFRAAITAAFSLLNISTSSTGINRCNKMIMLITDGAPEVFEDLFDEYNPEKNVRVFTYLLGQHSADENVIKRIACYNRGIGTNIANLADVKENVLKYIDVVARSNAILDDSFVRWSGVTEMQLSLTQLDASNFTRPPERVANEKNENENATLTEAEFGEFQADEAEVDPPKLPPLKPFKTKEKEFFITLSRAAFDRTNATVKDNLGVLLGVAGLDIPMDNFQDALRSWRIGPLSYFFGVNNNGFVLFHPYYRPMHGTQLKRYYINVDIDEVEQPMAFKLHPHTALPVYNSTLRTFLIDRSEASVVEDMLETPEDFLSGLPMTKKYFTAPLPGTPFVFGLAVRWVAESNRGLPIAKYDSRRLGSVRPGDTRVLNPQFKNPAGSCTINRALPYGSILAPLTFCKFRQELLGVFQEDPLCALRNVLIDKQLQIDNECDLEHVGSIFIDAQATAGIYGHWQRMANHDVVKKFNITQAFSIHQTGLLRYFNFSEPKHKHFLDEHNQGSEDPLYESAVLAASFYGNTKMLVFRPPAKQTYGIFKAKNRTVPMTVVSVVTNPKSEAVPMGIAGVRIGYESLERIFFNIVSECNTPQCLHCKSPDVQCFLTTTAGQIIFSTVDKIAISQNVKELDCALMEALVYANVIIEHEVYDFQAICIESITREVSFASGLFSPIAFVIRAMVHALHDLIIALASWLIWNPLQEAVAKGLWESIPPIEGEYVRDNNNPQNQPQDATNYNLGYRHGYLSHGDVDYTPPSRTVAPVDDPFYRDYEVLKPFKVPGAESPSTRDTSQASIDQSSPSVPVEQTDDTTATASGLSFNQNLPLFYETAQFYSQKNYAFEDPDDPWQMQQNALSELNTCYANEPALQPPPPQTLNITSNTTSDNSSFEIFDVYGAMDATQPLNLVTNLTNASLLNSTKSLPLPITPPKIQTAPGTLLRCVQRIVQMRCHAAVHSNNQIGRQACEVICDAARQRMPELTDFLHDCRQPLDSCTQRHSIFYLNKEAFAGRDQMPSYGGIAGGSSGQSKIHSGTYCPSCGNRDWVVSSIPDTNLLLIMTSKASGSPSINCNCECKRRYRYGAQLKSDGSIPTTQVYRRDPATPASCQMVTHKIENASACASLATEKKSNQLLIWISLLVASTLLRFM